MAGHSHWANIQRTKSKEDAKRGKIFSKWAKLIMNAARNGGPDPDMNLPLRYAIERARADNMPKDSIERAIKKGAGELDGVRLEEVTYEAYGPNGVALVIEALTDNRNRTAPDLRHILDRRGGSLGNSGSVLWMFERKAEFAVKRTGPAADEDEFMLAALEYGADDVVTDDDEVIGVTAEPGRFIEIKKALEEAGCELADAAIRYVPQNEVDLDAEATRKVIDLIEALEDNDDVQAVHHNANFADE
ncbi:MAG: YebC/PmpR family DNA-binding transcriptional regulator [Planctomycetota bacterium]|nr:MAG: YebC/PmpR family DNA-binding transcriptional regulator [Planctomycetota bacterium]